MDRKEIEKMICKAVEVYLPEKLDDPLTSIASITISDDMAMVIVGLYEDIAFLECEVMQKVSGEADVVEVGLRLVALI